MGCVHHLVDFGLDAHDAVVLRVNSEDQIATFADLESVLIPGLLVPLPHLRLDFLHVVLGQLEGPAVFQLLNLRQNV